METRALLRGALLATSVALGACSKAEPPAPAQPAPAAEFGTSSQAITREVSLLFPSGYIGTVGSNTQQADNISTFTTLNIVRGGFFQDDSDGDGLFTVQGNDVPGTVRLYFANNSSISFAASLTWRESAGSTINAFGFIPATDTTDLAFPAPYTGSIKRKSTAAKSNLAFRNFTTSASYSFSDGQNRSGNAANVNSMLSELNAVLTSAPKPSLISIANGSVTEGGNIVYTVTLSSATTTFPRIFPFVFEGTSTGGSDYVASYTFSNGVVNNGDGTITVPSGGVSSFTVTVATIDDATPESTETLVLNVADKNATANIADNDGPIALSPSGTTLGYTQGAAATIVDDSILVTGGSGTCSSATVEVKKGTSTLAQDVLACPAAAAITPRTCNVAGGVLTISGAGSNAQYQAALRLVTYANSVANNTLDTGLRTVTFGITDSNTTTASGTRPLQPVAQATVTVTPAASTANYGVATTFTATLGPSASTGSVQWKIDSVNEGGPVAVASGTGTLSNLTLMPGTYTISAVYSGDTERLGATGSTTFTVAQLNNGVGPCTASNEVAVCVSDTCNTVTGTCGGPVNTVCTNANECAGNVCDAGKCGTANGNSVGTGACTSGAAATVCQSGTCSVNGANCIPATNGCYVDGDCAAAKHCNRTTLTCVDDKAIGVAIPNDGIRNGTCAGAGATAACASGECNTTTNTCSGPNVTTTCAYAASATSAPECTTNVCGTNGKCGRTDGTAGCTVATQATACQSGVCSTNSGTCIAANTCWDVTDCNAGNFCARATGVCTPLTVCTATQYETVAATGLSDRTCANLTTCTASEYQTVAPTATSNRVCAPLTVCTASEYQTVAPTATSNRVCAPLTVCTASEYQTVAPTATSNRVCTPLTVCSASEYQTVAPTATTNRVCAPLTVCNASTQYELTAPTATTNRVCTNLTVCSAAQYESTAPTATTNRVCTNLTTCTASEYQSVAPTATTNRVCAPLTVCSASEYQSVAPTATTNRVCAPLTVCSGTQYESTAPTATTNRVCTTLTTCTASEYESTAATATTNRVCTPLTVCSATQYESAAPTATTNRVCTTLTTCTASEYQSVAPTATTNRVCAPLTVCSATQYESAAATLTTNRVCTNLTQCQSGEYEATPATLTSDRVCAPVGACGAGFYEASPPTATTNRVCLPLTVCTATEYEAAVPTATTDRVCAPKKNAGQNLPSTGPHGGGCSSSVALAVCFSGQCNAVTNTCSEPNNSGCGNANACTTNVCGSNGLCGTSNGSGTTPGGCTSSTAAVVCQSSTCSVNGANCIPATNGCYVDADCAAAKHCNRNTLTCVDDLAIGAAIPSDGLHDGTCNASNASATCLSGQCNATTNTCSGPNATTTCAYAASATTAPECTTNVCGSNGKCGRTSGTSGCTTGTATASCQSGLCSTNSNTCIAAGTCWNDSDCTAAQFCHRSTGVCTTDLAAGVSMPGDGLHSAFCNATDATLVCASGECNLLANTCGKPNGQICSSASECVSDTCTGGVCVPAGGCYVDADCPAAKHCNRNALTCVDDKPIGAAIPNDGLHNGGCNAANAAATCLSGECNPVTSTCAGPNTVTTCSYASTATSAPECVTNVCGSNGKCGTTNGGGTTPGDCRADTATAVCQSSTCSVNGTNCIPATNGCYVDADCAAAKHCNRSTLTCVDDKAVGVAIPNDGLHDGICSAATAALVCVSGECNAVTNTCAGPNTTTTCTYSASATSAVECVTNVCGSNGKCGRPDGSGPCFGAASTCQSGICNLTADGSTSACVPDRLPTGPARCWVDGDCPATDYCARNVFTCRPKESNGTPLPADTLHDACAAGDVNAACASGRCNPTTNTCGGPNVTTPCDYSATATSAPKCITNVCGANGKCGKIEGEEGCTAATAVTVCQSATCSTNTNTCIAAGTCWADADCTAPQHCNRNTGACTADKANGVPIPSDGLHTGVCNTSNASATCESTTCNATTNTCGGPNVTTSCTNANECVTNACGSDGKCGLVNGQAGCSATNTGVCQSNTCSVNGTHCIPTPQANGCYVDGDCPAAKHCDRNALTCVDDKANGVAIPSDGLHTGVCNDANATATCQSGKCNAVTNTCAGPNVTTTCANANECVTNACGSNGKCGYADGESGCTTAEPTRCQSNVCTASGVCLPAGKCWVDSDCPATDYCARNENTCRPKEKSGTPIPNDGLHDGGCTSANAQATCASGKCNAETKTCGEVNETTCAQATECTSNVCYPDGACGVPSEQACASDSQCRSGSCISGFCANPGAEVRGNGGLRCAVTATSAASNETSPAWLLGLALTLAVSRRRKAARTTHTNANAQR